MNDGKGESSASAAGWCFEFVYEHLVPGRALRAAVVKVEKNKCRSRAGTRENASGTINRIVSSASYRE
ncbi:unnamed protein product [Ixodes pacificus]